MVDLGEHAGVKPWGWQLGCRDLKSKREVLRVLEGPGRNLAGVKEPREWSWSRTEVGTLGGGGQGEKPPRM